MARITSLMRASSASLSRHTTSSSGPELTERLAHGVGQPLGIGVELTGHADRLPQRGVGDDERAGDAIPQIDSTVPKLRWW